VVRKTHPTVVFSSGSQVELGNPIATQAELGAFPMPSTAWRAMTRSQAQLGNEEKKLTTLLPFSPSLRRFPLRLGLDRQVPGVLQAMLAGEGVFLDAGLAPGADHADAGFPGVGLSLHIKLRYSV
jgi:hypothetical protein